MKISHLINSKLLPIHYHNKLIEFRRYILSTKKLAEAQYKTAKSKNQVRKIITKGMNFKHLGKYQKVSSKFNHIFRK